MRIRSVGGQEGTMPGPAAVAPHGGGMRHARLVPVVDDPANRFAELYRAHYTAVCDWIRALGTPPPYNEDVAQDVFLVVHRRMADFIPGRSFRAWLFGIARRVNRDHSRGRRRTEARERTVLAPVPLPPAEDAVAHDEALSFMHDFVDGLDSEKRIVFVLSDIDDMSTPEIAEALGVPVKLVRSRLRTARERFKAAAEQFQRAASKRHA